MSWIEASLWMVITRVVYRQPIYIYNSQCEGPKASKIVHVNEGTIMVHNNTRHKQAIVVKITPRLSRITQSSGPVRQSATKNETCVTIARHTHRTDSRLALACKGVFVGVCSILSHPLRGVSKLSCSLWTKLDCLVLDCTSGLA